MTIKTMPKLMALIIAVAMIISIVPTMVSAATFNGQPTATISGTDLIVTYNLTDGSYVDTDQATILVTTVDTDVTALDNTAKAYAESGTIVYIDQRTISEITDTTNVTDPTIKKFTIPLPTDILGGTTLFVKVGGTAIENAAPTSVTTLADEATLSSIAITHAANKLAYKVGESLSIDGLIVTGTYSDGSTKDETITTANITGFDSTAVAETQTLTINVDGKIATYNIVINPATLSSLAITTPAQRIYTVGDSLNIADLVVTGTYSDGTTKVETITTDNITGFNSAVAVASQPLTITVGNITTSYDIVINPVVTGTLVSIAITHPATKLTYVVGDELDIDGLVVTGTYNDTLTKVETITIAANITGFDSSSAIASQTITITVGGKTTSYDIVINAAVVGPTMNITFVQNTTSSDVTKRIGRIFSIDLGQTDSGKYVLMYNNAIIPYSPTRKRYVFSTVNDTVLTSNDITAIPVNLTGYYSIITRTEPNTPINKEGSAVISNPNNAINVTGLPEGSKIKDLFAVYGDVNSSGIFDSNDLTLLKNKLGGVTSSSMVRMFALDVSGDGVVDSTDLTQCKNLIAGTYYLFYVERP